MYITFHEPASGTLVGIHHSRFPRMTSSKIQRLECYSMRYDILIFHAEYVHRPLARKGFRVYVLKYGTYAAAAAAAAGGG